jgi:sugar lactone lactonase YvrE
MALMANQPTVLMSGIAFGECPRWHDGRLWFSDWLAHEIIAMAPDGRSEVVVRVPFETFPFSFDFLPDGRMLIVSNSDQPLLRRELDGTLVPHATLPDGWNEIVVDAHGNAYINGVGFQMMAGQEFRPGQITLVAPDGVSRQVADGIMFPNGMAISPHGRTLIVAESYASKLTAYDIAEDATLSAGRTWAELDGPPDGICFDAEGAIWYASVPDKRCVRVREGGEVLQTVDVDRGCFACMLGGDEAKTLYIVASEWNGPSSMTGETRTGQILAIEVDVPHAGWP